MPRSSIALSEYDGKYVFNIENYLCSNYNGVTKPIRRAMCSIVREKMDSKVIESLIDKILDEHAVDLQGWSRKTDGKK